MFNETLIIIGFILTITIFYYLGYHDGKKVKANKLNRVFPKGKI